MNWFIEVVKKYAVFNGRARRKEYWMFVLFYILIAIALAIVEGVIRSRGLLGMLLGLGLLLPSLGVSIRRLHDTDRSGWWLLIGFVPLVGGIVLLVFMCLDGSSGANQYGPDPKAGAVPVAS
jgi:uncharacterized membrane protein YhaH (DUF805 family)